MDLVDDAERCYRAVRARDARFDGVFYTAVRTTGIYCRPSCPAVTPKQGNVTFYRTAAAAHGAGYRACRRCRPDTTPGSPEWNARADAVGRAMRMIRDGVVEDEGVAGLADRLGFSARHVGRILHAELGAGPLALARSGRAHHARVLVETTDLPMADVAFAAGFSSIRQFNATMREVYALTPGQMRIRRRGDSSRTLGGRLHLDLAVRQPFDHSALLAFLGARAVPGVEVVHASTYARVMRLPHGTGVAALQLSPDKVACTLELTDLRDTARAVERCRALLDLDADPVAVDDTLRADPVLVPMVRSAPGLRLPGHVDGFELAVRAVVGQQVSVAGARTTAARIAARLGEPVEHDLGATHGLTHAFPTATELSAADPTTFGLPRRRAEAIVAVSEAVAGGEIDLRPGADTAATHDALLALPGIGPWTAGYVTMRALADPDVLLDTDLVVRRGLDRVGRDVASSAAWRPWRSYVVMHLWRAAATSPPTEHDKGA